MTIGLTRAEWDDLRRRVWERDLRAGYETALARGLTDLSFAGWISIAPYGACVAWQLEPRLWGDCGEGIEFDHVHETGETATGMKADDDERHLQVVCGWHHGTRRTGGGYITSKDAREASRARLADLYAA